MAEKQRQRALCCFKRLLTCNRSAWFSVTECLGSYLLFITRGFTSVSPSRTQQTPHPTAHSHSCIRPVMDSDGNRNRSLAIRGSPDDPHATTRAAMFPPSLDNVLSGEKTGAFLLFSGLFLLLAGVLFTNMGWQRDQVDSALQWSQLLGPILIAIGGTFMLTSVCRLTFNSLLPCVRSACEAPGPAADQAPGGHSLTLSGVNQQVMLCGGTAVLSIPPPYSFVNQEACPARELQPANCISGVCGAHNEAFSMVEEGSSTHRVEADGRHGRWVTAVVLLLPPVQWFKLVSRVVFHPLFP